MTSDQKIVVAYCEAKQPSGQCKARKANGSAYCEGHQIELAVAHLNKALACLTDEFNAGRAGPSGLRAQAIAQVREALVTLGRQPS